MSICADYVTTDEVERFSECCDLSSYDPYQVADTITAVSEAFYTLLAGQFPGVCEVTVRPCSVSAARRSSPVLINGVGRWVPSGYCSCNQPVHRGCGCCGVSQVRLGVGPIQSVTEVVVDGVVLNAASYRLDDNGRYLVRLPNVGETTARSWPCCQRLDLPDTEEDTWSVTVMAGTEPPMLVKIGAAKWVCEMLRGMNGDDCCFTPKAVESMTREGVSFAVNDPAAFLEAGLMNIYEVDSAIKTWNPHGLRRGPFLASPDLSPRSVIPGS